MIGKRKAYERVRLSIVALLTLNATPGWAASAADPGPAGSLSGLLANPNSPAQRLATALQQLQMTRCAPVVQKVAEFLMEDGQANFTVQPLGQPVDQWPVVITIETYHSAEAQTRFSTIVVDTAAGCSGMYEQVVNWDDTCANIKSKIFGAFKSEALLLKQIHVSETSPAVQLYTLPAGKGCTTVKKELFR